MGPGPRAFHVAVALECHLFVFGGRSGQQRLGDLWMLDTDSWQWVDLSAYGHQPPPRDFAAAAPLPNGKLVLCGGWDGSKWLADAWILDTGTGGGAAGGGEPSFTSSVLPPPCAQHLWSGASCQFLVAAPWRAVGTRPRWWRGGCWCLGGGGRLGAYLETCGP